jgi:hypothetical protein
MSLWAYVDDWLFGRRSPAAFGLFRIVICTIAFINLAMIAIDFDSWFTQRGFVPLEAAKQYSQDAMTWVGTHRLPFPIPRINFLAEVTSTPIIAAFYGLTMLACLLTLVGLWTRVSSIVLALGVITLHHRNLLILHGGDTAIRQYLILVALGPSGAALSLDRVIAVWQGRAPRELPPISLWAQRLVQFEIAIMYFTTVWYKWMGSHWRDGTATYYIHQLKEFDRFPVPWFMDRQPFVGLTTYGTLLTELALATLVFYRPFRKWILLAGVLMHGYIEYRFNIPLFAFIVISAYICFFDGEEVSAWARRLGERYRMLHLKVLLPKGLRMEGPRADAIKTMDALSVVSYETGDTDEWQAFAPKHRWFARLRKVPTEPSETPWVRKRNPFRSAWKRSLGAIPIGLVPGLWKRLMLKAPEEKS